MQPAFGMQVLRPDGARRLMQELYEEYLIVRLQNRKPSGAGRGGSRGRGRGNGFRCGGGHGYGRQSGGR